MPVVADLWPIPVQLPTQMPPLGALLNTAASATTAVDPLVLVLGMSWFIILVMAFLQWRLLVAFSDIVKLTLAPKPVPQIPTAQPPASSVPFPTPMPSPQPVPMPPQPPQPPTPAPVTHPLVDDALVNFTAKQEGYSSKAYWDYKQYTIGYGTRANSATEVITEAEARTRLMAELNKAAKSVAAFIPNAPRGVQQAMVDATFNLGTGWQSQSLGAALKAGDYARAAADLLEYNHAGGQVLPALTKRREAEVSWFQNPI